MKMIDFIKTMDQYDKDYYRLVDFEKIFDEDKITLQKSIERFVKNDLLVRLSKDIYVLSSQNFNLSKIANQLYSPSYLSLESVLFKAGVMNQAPQSLTFVTTRRTKRFLLANTECQFSQIKPDLWWGIELINGVYTAELEKAIVDMLYLRKRGKKYFETDEWYWQKVDQEKLSQYLPKAELGEVTALLKAVFQVANS